MPRLALVLALALTGLASTGCKKQAQQRPDRVGRDDATVPADPRLPAPHPLAARPEAAGFVADPAALLQATQTFVPTAPPLAKVAEFMLGTQGPADWAQATAGLLAGDRAWAGVHVAGEDVLHVPLTKAGVKQAQALLAKYPTRGDFGAALLPLPAVQLRAGTGQTPPSPAPTRLAWIDPRAGTLTLADTLQGLATGRELQRAYGAKPVWFTIGEARGKFMFGEFPYSRAEAGGVGLHSLDITVTARAGQPLPTIKGIAPGALTGALGKDLVLGASTRWTGYKDAVRGAIHQLQAQVDGAGFAGKMMLDPLANQVTRLLKMWNGRVLLGIGPARHVRIGLGAEDAHAAHRVLLTLSRDVIDNLQLARMFVGNIPNVSLKRTAEDPDIWLLTIGGIANQLPAELRTLAEDGRLRLAFSSSAHAGAMLFVVGPRADAELKTWVAEANAGVSGKQGMTELASATIAISPASLFPLIQSGDRDDWIKTLLGLTADRSPTRVVLSQVEQRFEISVRGPEPQAKPDR